MEAQHLSVMSTWIFVFFFLSVCSGMDPPKLSLESTVFVACTSEDFSINCTLELPANQSRKVLTCSDPLNKQIYSFDIDKTTGERVHLRLELKNLNMSGEYSCQYETARVYWFVRVRSDFYTGVVRTEYVVVAVFIGLLLVFSVAGSVCVFRGHGKEHSAESGNTGRKRQQNREERKEREMEKDNIDAITAPSTSFYASLETRPRSIYDVLDHSAANRKPGPSKAKPKKKEPKQTVAQTTQDPHEGVFESVYENF